MTLDIIRKRIQAIGNRGATAIEYALIASIMVVAIMASVPLLRAAVVALYETIVRAFEM